MVVVVVEDKLPLSSFPHTHTNSFPQPPPPRCRLTHSHLPTAHTPVTSLAPPSHLTHAHLHSDARTARNTSSTPYPTFCFLTSRILSLLLFDLTFTCRTFTLLFSPHLFESFPFPHLSLTSPSYTCLHPSPSHTCRSLPLPTPAAPLTSPHRCCLSRGLGLESHKQIEYL